MGATFDYVLKYDVQLTCASPLRTGSTYGGTEDVLRDTNGIPFFQASSLAGSLRCWLEAAEGKRQADALFGSSSRMSELLFTDIRFAESTDTALRPRLRIDWNTGAAADKAKFDVANLSVGSRGSFTVLWFGTRERWETSHQSITRMLAALHRGQIRLGAQKSNGFGLVHLQVQFCRFDMTRQKDRESWLDRVDTDLQRLALPELENAGALRFVVKARADSILIKSPQRERAGNDKKSVFVNIRENGTPILPGSSVKGAVRSRVTAIARQMGVSDAIVNAAFGRGDLRGNAEDNGIAGKIFFSDAALRLPRRTAISRIRIDRLTGGVITKGLFTEQPLCSPVTMEIEAPASGHDQVCALLVFALRDLGLGLYTLGSGSSVGRGRMNVESIEITHPQWTASLTFSDGQLAISDPDGGLQRLLGALKGGKMQ